MPVFFHFSMKMEFSRRIFKNGEIWNLIKIRPVGAALLHSDRRSDIMKLVVAFRNLQTLLKCKGSVVILVTKIKFSVREELDVSASSVL